MSDRESIESPQVSEEGDDDLPKISKLSLDPPASEHVILSNASSHGEKPVSLNVNSIPNSSTNISSNIVKDHQNHTVSASAGIVPKLNGALKSNMVANLKANAHKDSAVDEDSSEMSEDGSWISWFCSLRGNEFFCEVDEDYIQDDFNLTGLHLLVPYYDYALDMVLDVEMPMEEKLTEAQQEIVESAAVSLNRFIFTNFTRCNNLIDIICPQQEMLYGMIHARYILTNRGMHAMYEKFRSAAFGRCPHVFCQGQPVLPVGLSDLPRNYTVNVFCPRCHGLFFPKSTRQANIDGAYFGTTFPHLYLMTHPVSLMNV